MDKCRHIYLIATLDTKEKEALFLKDRIQAWGHSVKVINAGTGKHGDESADIGRKEILGENQEKIEQCQTRTEALSFVTAGVKSTIERLFNDGCVGGVISLGGSGGCSIAAEAMHSLPMGIPKIIVTTMASGNTLPYMQGEDILMINPVVDIQNMNSFTKYMLSQAASILHGMLEVEWKREDKKVIAITCFGVTTPCVERCAELLERAGYEVLIFHASGVSGGKIMEKMVREGIISAVLDVTVSEVADEVCGGIYGVANRMQAIVEKDIPYVVSAGALEMINLSTADTLKDWQRDRVLYTHSPSSVKMRTETADMEKLADLFAERLGRSRGKVEMVIPLKGFSSVNQEGGVFFDPEVNAAFVNRIKEKMPEHVPVLYQDVHINDAAFADILVKEMEALIQGDRKDETLK